MRVARLAYQIAQTTLPRYTHRNSPHTYTQPQLVACVLLGFYLDVSYRDLEEWLLASDQVCQVLALSSVPDYSTLCRAFQRLRMPRWWALHRCLLRTLQVEAAAMAADATAFTASRASVYSLSRTGRQMRDYIKGDYSVGVERQYITAWHYAPGPGGSDAQYLDSLRRPAHSFGVKVGGRRAWIMLADKGFDGSRARPDDLIPPRQGQQPVVRADRRLRLELVGQAQLDGFMGQRWKVETVLSVMKRKSGDAIRSLTQDRQRREIAVKALVYSLHRLPCPRLSILISNFATEQLRAGFPIV